MKLYHNGMSTCSQKVRLVLAEKGLDFDSQIMDLQKGDQFESGYLKLNPSALVPSLEDQGRVYIESTLINDYLEDAYPEPSLLPAGADARYRMRFLIRQIDEVQHPACSVITYAIGLRPVMLKKQPQELQAMIDQIRDPARREGRRAVLSEGIHAPVFRTALLQYLEVMKGAEELLAAGPWIAGEQYSLGDCALLPYVLRLDHLDLLPLLDKQPALLGWYERMQARSTYKKAIADWLPEKAVQLFRAGGTELQQQVLELV